VLRGNESTAVADAIVVQGARVHNLKNLSVHIPRGQFVVVTGVSGSGKSTLAFDLIFAEGQRRFLDAMNAYARQFVDQLARPDVDFVAGLPPTVSIEQRNSRGGGKSTVATVTEIHHFLRLLFARIGLQYCPDCQLPVEAQTHDALAKQLAAERLRRGGLVLLAPVVRNRKGFHTDVGEWAARKGYAQVRVDGNFHSTAERLRLERYKEHDIEVVIGKLESGRRTRTARSSLDLVAEALEVGQGILLALDSQGKVSAHSTARACSRCGRSFERLDPKHFSYNSPVGWCLRCRGFGELFYLPDVDRGARADAIEESWFGWQEGKRERCPECAGMRLNPVARAVRLLVDVPTARRPAGASAAPRPPGIDPRHPPTLDTFARASVSDAFAFFRTARFRGPAAQIARDILPEIRERLRFLDQVGLGYLELGRGVPTLSGGEAQRIRLAAQLGSNLSGVLYVLDEPTIGLHARDNERLLDTLRILQARGNSLLVVEHDEATMRRADFVVDLGPGAGTHGGHVVATGTLAELANHPDSVTGRCLRERPKFPMRGQRREVAAQHPRLVLERARLHNLRDLTLRLPLGRLVVITGLSGSGKSTLLRECLLPTLAASLRRAARGKPPEDAARGRIVAGHENLRAVYEVDQSPIGRTPRSVPATYVGFFDDIRALFAQLPEARLRGYRAGRFSFNSAEGRCAACQGSGTLKLEMNFLPPAFTRCEDCQGLRFSAETLDIRFGGRNIAEVLELSVEEALDAFSAFPRIRRPLELLRDTGLGYLKLGQTSPTLSGGEAQRVKLVTHLLGGIDTPGGRAHPAGKRNLFLLEEPTIGLHMTDVRLLVEVLNRLVDGGHTVVVIEHNLDLIAEADWVVDLGPEGGAAGGRIVVEGAPESVAACRSSHTGQFLKRLLHRQGGRSVRLQS
jgi:excinuclease ABC subunit A